MVRWSFVICMLLALPSAGCNSKKSASADAAVSPSPTASAAAAAPEMNAEPQGPVMHIDSAKALNYVKEIVSFGPRWPGSKGQEKVAAYLRNKLKADNLEEDAFVADTPVGKLPMRNFVAKFQGTKDGIIVLGSHIDTNYPLRSTGYIGANDGGSSTALLLAISDQLRGKKLDGYSVWLTFFDGEEAVESSWTDTNSTYGSRHLAAKWQQDGTISKIKAFMLADMLGDADLTVFRDQNSTPWLEDLVLKAAQRLGYQSHFFAAQIPVSDDHMSFAHYGVPVADLIDFDYGYNNSYWHTTQDTIDKLSPRSLQISGDVILEAIRLLNANQLPASGALPKSS
jgi:glutaminyl-peptide cyclotransferase